MESEFSVQKIDILGALIFMGIPPLTNNTGKKFLVRFGEYVKTLKK